MIKKIVLALAAACSLNALADINVDRSDVQDYKRAVAPPSAKMPPICWILPTVGCR